MQTKLISIPSTANVCGNILLPVGTAVGTAVVLAVAAAGKETPDFNQYAVDPAQGFKRG